MRSNPRLFCQHQQLPPSTAPCLIQASSGFPLALDSLLKMESSNLWLQIKHCPSGANPSICLWNPFLLLPSYLGEGPWMLILAPFLGPGFPSGLCALRTLGSDVGLSFVVPVHTCSLACNELDNHKPLFVLFGTVWPALTWLWLSVLCGFVLSCFQHAFNEATLLKKKKFVHYIVFSDNSKTH